MYTLLISITLPDQIIRLEGGFNLITNTPQLQ
jgi:hypothetical protein